MKRIFSNRQGKVFFADVPIPSVIPGFVLVKNLYSLISTGTETRTLSSSPVQRIVAHSKTLVKKTCGLFQGKNIKKEALEGGSLGYSCVGQVVECSEGVKIFSVGDLVVCAGYGYAVHAEYVCVPASLVFRVSSSVKPEAAVFTALASVSLHAVRRAQASVGENALVVGLGLTGQLCASLLRLSGCHVIGVDPHSHKCELAKTSGGSHVICQRSGYSKDVIAATEGSGADFAILCADIRDGRALEEIASCVRDRGRIVLIGNFTGEFPFSIFFRKEIDLLPSRSFGPGRFDDRYERDGHDYPPGYVRWTEGRNMGEILHLLESGQLPVSHLAEKIFPFDDALKGYALLKSKERPVAILLSYS